MAAFGTTLSDIFHLLCTSILPPPPPCISDTYVKQHKTLVASIFMDFGGTCCNWSNRVPCVRHYILVLSSWMHHVLDEAWWLLFYTWPTGEESCGIVVGPSPKGADYLAIEYERDGRTIFQNQPPNLHPNLQPRVMQRARRGSMSRSSQCAIARPRRVSFRSL